MDLLTDLRFAVRRWSKRRAFAATAVLTLALGIGSTTAIFSVVEGALLKPLPWYAADRLVTIWVARPHWRTNPALAAWWNRGDLSWPIFRSVQQNSRTLEAVGTYRTPQLILSGERNEIVTVMQVSASFLPMLGVQPYRGRFFEPSEDDVATAAVLVTYETWMRRFGAAENILGTHLTLDRVSREIVGVLPPQFRFHTPSPNGEPEFLVPWGNYDQGNRSAGNHFMWGLARLRPGVTLEQAQTEIAPFIQAGASEVKMPRLSRLDDDQRGELRRPLWLLFTAAFGLLVIACANVAGLLLGEAAVRRHEIAVRIAVGGSARRLARQLMVEAAVLAGAAGILGVLAAWWFTPILLDRAPVELPRGDTAAIDAWVLAFAAALTTATTLIFGVGPLLSLLGGAPGRTLIEGGRDAGLRRQHAHRSVVIVQVAIATVLLAIASLLGETVVRLSAQPPGFEPRNVLTILVRGSNPTREWVERHALRNAAMIARLSSLPGVESVAATAMVPFSGGYGSNSITIERKTFDREPSAARQIVSDGYFALMRIPILEGRAFDATDRANARVAIVSSTFAKTLMDGAALGKRFTLNREIFTVVGVVPDVKQQEYSDPDRPTFYLLERQMTSWSVNSFLIRTAGPPEQVVPAVRNAVAAEDPSLVIVRIDTMTTLLARSIAEERYRALLSTVFGGAAVLLAMLGLYGLVARSVMDRLREFGVRAALGATPLDIRRLILKEGTTLVGVGLAIGIPAALAAAQAIGSMLYGVAPLAPHTFLIVTAMLTGAAYAGMVTPEYRAGRVDPAVALRDQ
jgi:putative ABC transport system permease protein